MDKTTFAVTDPTACLDRSTDVEGVGVFRWYNQKLYRWVLNNETSTDFTVGQVVFHKLSDNATMFQNVYQCLTANLGVMAGVVLTNGIAHAKYNYIQCYGYNGSVSVSGATTGGTNVAIGDYLKGVNAASHVVRDAATQPLYTRNIQILTTVTTTTTPAAALQPGFIDCL